MASGDGTLSPKQLIVPAAEIVAVKSGPGGSTVALGPSAKWLAALEATMAVNGYTRACRSGPGLMTYLLWKEKTSR